MFSFFGSYVFVGYRDLFSVIMCDMHVQKPNIDMENQ